ncbi:MAG: GAF domain-containing protein [Microbacteriaceae bacterium]|nr:GAF domain-containing protein [Microbacteriaceae bacterium]
MAQESDDRLAEPGVGDDVRAVLDAYRTVLLETSEPSEMLRRAAEVAAELIGAQFAAILTTGPDGSVERFIHAGMSEDEAAATGRLPEGRGLLGVVIDEQRAVLLDDLADDERSSGFPPGHPPMRSFLGMPIRVRGGAYAYLYLTHREAGRFTRRHAETLDVLAGTVALGIDSALVTAENRQREALNAAVLEVTAALLAADDDEALGILADRVLALVDADSVSVLTPLGDGSLIVDLTRGGDLDESIGLVLPRFGTLSGQVFESGQPMLATGIGRGYGDRFDSIALAPLAAGGRPVGVLTASRFRGRPAFNPRELRLVSEFAGQASIALVLTGAREARQRLALLEDRARIAQDLHDHVIQRIFAAGLSLQAVASRSNDEILRRQIFEQISSLDSAIAEIRTAIFAMTSRPDARANLRHLVIDAVGATARHFPSAPQLVFSGSIDLLVPSGMHEDVLAVVREGLANIGKHAGPFTAVQVTLAATEDGLEIAVVDDGAGIPAGVTRSSGIQNLRNRAQSWGGAFELGPAGPDGGTRLIWRAPYGRKDGDP